LATPMCRSCMRSSHKANPFHRIEQWNGSYFRPAELWEVGSYLLVRHHTGDAICETLKRWSNLLESAEATKDGLEQDQLRKTLPGPSSGPSSGPIQVHEMDSLFNDDDIDIDMGDADMGDAATEDAMDLDDLFDGDDLCDADEEIEDYVNPYLTSPNDGAEFGADIDPALASATLGSNLRVVHSNGLHNIAMVSCQCHGEDVLHLDLAAVQLLPASFKRIKTLFTVQVLDMFRLSNLELKASAYQFYQLLCRHTRPMAPAEVPNLYREFRRMSRLWRWMKKLKWAGYAGNSKSVNEVKAGELSIFCPACPQQNINIPDNWKDDPQRHVKQYPNLILCLTSCGRWVYKRILVGDGNFKADHVRQKSEAGDIWLSEGSGMIPRREEYLSFLATAIERLTVSASLSVPNWQHNARLGSLPVLSFGLMPIFAAFD